MHLNHTLYMIMLFLSQCLGTQLPSSAVRTRVKIPYKGNDAPIYSQEHMWGKCGMSPSPIL